jgi:hypothetical protein
VVLHRELTGLGFTEVLLAFVLDRGRPDGIYCAKSIVVAVCALIRFLA